MLISETTLKCCKPNRFISFKSEDLKHSQGKAQYKHYEQMDDDVLALRSVIKAHKEVQNSNKMRLFKALPEITTALVGTTIALAQPGKLAAKAGAGLGFLALTKLIGAAGDKVIENKKQNKEQKPNTRKVLLTTAKVALGAAAVALGAVALKHSKIPAFLQKEASQLAGEINNTKLGKLVENKLLPFTKKHSKVVEVLGNVLPFGIIGASALTQVKLGDSLSKNLKEKATFNYTKGKLIQQEARAHFDSIDAQEV